jgi:hypothetical protein
MLDITLTNDSATAITSIVYTGPEGSGTLVYADLTPEQKIKVDNFMPWMITNMEEGTCKFIINVIDAWTVDFVYASGSSCTDEYVNLCDTECMDPLDKSKLGYFLSILV